MEKRWLAQYEQGVPYEINPDSYTSLTALLEESLEKFKDKPAFTNMGEAISFQELDKLSQQMAHFLQQTGKIKKGDRIAIMLPNILQYPVALLGILRVGAIVVNVNPLYTPRELRHILTDSQVKGVIVLENFAHTLASIMPEIKLDWVMVTKLGDLLGNFKGNIINFIIKYVKKMVPPYELPGAYFFKDILKRPVSFQSVNLTANDIAFLQYTGGTTGIAKGAMLSHQNLIANILQAHAWIINFLKKPLKFGIITPLPLYHIFSLLANCLVFMHLGVVNILITNPKDIKGFVKILKKQKFSVMTGVDTLFNALVNYPEFKNVDFSELRYVLGGGMAVRREVAKRWQAITGVAISEAYGLTETSPAVTVNPLNIKEYNGSIGLPLPSTDVKICDENGNEVALGERGELWVKGPQVMQGYWQHALETAKVLTKDRWLKTGDIAIMDAKGFLRIVDRKKDMIIVSGFNVYPNEIEAVLIQMPGIKEVAVIGVPDEKHGEVVKAFIVKSNLDLTEEAVLEFCHQQLTGYKVPKLIEFTPVIPKTTIGKVSHRLLREQELMKFKGSI